MIKVSVIIPVYNTKKYLEKCLDSIINQTLQEIEIICVNDGSTDGSDTIINAYAKKDSRIKVINKENGGLVAARKTGVRAAQGTYVGYVDSDDWIEPDMYEKLYAMAEKNQSDLVTCGYYLDGNYQTVHLDTVDEGKYDDNKMAWLRDNVIYRPDKKETGLRGGLWCKLFKREILLGVQENIPNEISMAEDKMCLLHYMLHGNSVYVLKEPLYHWCIHSESMSHKADTSYLLKVNEVYKYLVTLYQHENFTEKMRAQAELYITELLVLGINNRLGFQNKNLLRIDPYWLEEIPAKSTVAIYGGGDVGEQYMRQMKRRQDVSVAEYFGFEMPTKEKLQSLTFDYILIAIKNQGKAMQVKEQFTELGVAEEKILWFAQPEVYWKYAEAEGLLE